MAWSDEMVVMLRAVIGDMNTPYEFNDASLQQLLVSAGQLIVIDVEFPQTYVFDHANPNITPDPTLPPRDDGFINLCVLKAACLLGYGEWRKKAREGMSVKDDVSSIDMRTVSGDTKAWAQDLCKAYEQAEMDYKLGHNIPGQAIVGPHKA